MSNSEQNPLKPNKKPRRPRSGLSIRKFNLHKSHQKIMTILDREINHLMMDSIKGKLSKDASASLVNYMKVLADLKKIEAEALEEMSDEQLAKIAGEKDDK